MKAVRSWAGFLSLAALLVVAAACGRWFVPQSGTVKAEAVAEAVRPDVEVSPFVAELARQYEVVHPDAAKGLAPGQTVRLAYAQAFQAGLEQMQCTDGYDFSRPDNGPPLLGLVNDAQAAGRAARDDHPAELDAAMAARGYRRMNVVGTWARGFEISSFAPADGSGETWTFGRMGKFPCRVTILGDPSWNDLPARVRFDGYVSGRGQFGHLGGYDREFLVLTVTPDGA